MRDSSTFGHRLKQVRQAQGLTQDALADRVGCATQTIRKIEGGQRRPSFHMAARIADVLGIDTEARASFLRSAREQIAEDERDVAEQPAVVFDPSDQPQPRRLPTPLTRLVGREQECATLQQLLRNPEIRLLTLSGAGGAGKTRLALEVAAGVADVFPDGVVFVNLVPVREPELVIPTIAAALGIHEEGGTALIDRLREGLQAQRLLLLLDNFEQVMPAASLVADLLAACRGVKALVTSREMLRVRGEHVFPVPTLPVPDPAASGAVDAAQYAAVQLFAERAMAVMPGFALTSANAADVAALCRRLDGLPLAIELAAARSNLFTPDAMLARLGSRLKLLTGGLRDMPARQQTLRNTIAWSYDLLTEHEQKLLRHLSVFIGGRTLDAIEAVCAATGDDEIVDGLASLIDKSLVWQGASAGRDPWFLMLETIWEFAAEQLEHSGEAEAVRRAHAQYYLHLVERAERHLWGGEQERWVARLEQEHDNIRAALAWYAAQDEGIEPGLRMAGLLWRFWDVRGHWTEGRQWLEMALARRAQADPSAVWIALHGAGNLALNLGDYVAAQAYYEESLAITRRLDIQRGIANSLLNLSLVICYQGDYQQAIALQQDALAIYRALNNTIGIALALTNLADMAEQQGDYGQATTYAEECLAHYRELRDSRGIAMALHTLALVAQRRGAYDDAHRLFDECRTLREKLHDRHDLIGLWSDLGDLCLDEGQVDAARTHYEASLRLATELGDRRHHAAVLRNLGRLALHTGEFERAHELCSRSLTLQRDLGDRRGIALALETLGQIALGQGDEHHAAALFTESMSLAEAVGDQPCVARCHAGLARIMSMVVAVGRKDELNRQDAKDAKT